MSSGSNSTTENPLATLGDAPNRELSSPRRITEDIKNKKLSEAEGREYLLFVQNLLGGPHRGHHTTAKMHAAATTIQKHARGHLTRALLLAKRQAERLIKLAHLQEFSAPELLTLAGSCTAPLLDAASDFSVMAVWATSGNEYQPLLWASVVIHICAGSASGIVFTKYNMKRRKHLGFDSSAWLYSTNYFLGIMLGWAGFTSSVQAYLAVVDATDTEIKDVVARDDFKHLRWLNTMDLLLEHVPQLCLQAFVGIAHGDLDPHHENFSVVLMASVIVGLIMPGFTLFSFEQTTRNLNRREVRMAHRGGEITHMDFEKISLRQPYAICATLWRSCSVMAMILWLAISMCAFGYWGFLAVPFILLPFAMSVHEAAFERRNRDLGGRSLRSQRGCNGLVLAGFLDLLLVGVMAALATIFYTQEHVENTLAAASSGTGQISHDSYSCAEQSWMMFAAWLASFLTLALTPVILVLDPEHGMTSTARRLQTGPDHTMADEEILQSWLDDRPPKGHRGTITFQLNRDRRKRLHQHCDKLKDQGIRLFDRSSRVGGIRKLMVTLPAKNLPESLRQEYAASMKHRENEGSVASVSNAETFDLG